MLGRLYRAIGGAKTLVLCAGVFVVGLADFFDYIDLRPLLEHYLGADRAGTIMMFLSLVFGAVRYFWTTGPARWSPADRRMRGDYDEEYDNDYGVEDEDRSLRRYARVDEPSHDVDRYRRRSGRGRVY